MATGQPTSKKLELEQVYGSGSWTDITTYVEGDQSIVISSPGRLSPTGTTQPRTLTFTLDNTLGTFTPHRQVLADGTTSHPYWPNIVPGRRVRYSYVSSATTYVRFLGKVQAWPPSMENGVRGLITVTAIDLMDDLSRVTLQSPILQELSVDSPGVVWPLSDAVASTSAADLSGNLRPSLAVVQAGTGGPLTFGSNGPGPLDGTGVLFAPSSLANGQFLTGSLTSWFTDYTNSTFEVWFQTTTVPGSTTTLLNATDANGVFTPGSAVFIGLTSSGFASSSVAGTGVAISPTNLADGSWHHVAVVITGGTNFEQFVDGVSVGTASGAAIAAPPAKIYVGQASPDLFTSALFTGGVGYVTITAAALSSTRIAAHAAAGVGYTGDHTGARIARYLSFAGLTSANWNLDTGAAVLGHYQTAGQTVLQACQDMVTSESGGSVIWVEPDGKVRFADRTYRNPTSPVLTVDAVKDLGGGSSYAPSLDKYTLINRSTGSRNSGSGIASTQVWVDSVSIAANGTFDDGGFTSYATTDVDVLGVAQWKVASGGAAWRLQKITVSLVSAETNLYAALGVLQIGDRLRMTSVPSVGAPQGQFDAIVEGWSETITDQDYTIEIDTSPSDAPARMLVGSATNSTVCPDAGSMTLNASITASATSLAVATVATHPTLSTAAGDYPQTIQFGEEQMTVTAAPGSGTSPQTLTVTRGVNGTVAAAQTAGAAFSYAPAMKVTL